MIQVSNALVPRLTGQLGYYCVNKSCMLIMIPKATLDECEMRPGCEIAGEITYIYYA